MRHCQKEKLNGRKVEIEQANSQLGCFWLQFF